MSQNSVSPSATAAATKLHVAIRRLTVFPLRTMRWQIF
jgi:hypothetical protein